MSDLDALIQQLAKATGLSEDLAEAVVETASEYVKAQRPDQAEQVDAALADEAVARRAGDMLGTLGRKVRPEEDATTGAEKAPVEEDEG